MILLASGARMNPMGMAAMGMAMMSAAKGGSPGSPALSQPCIQRTIVILQSIDRVLHPGLRMTWQLTPSKQTRREKGLVWSVCVFFVSVGNRVFFGAMLNFDEFWA